MGHVGCLVRVCCSTTVAESRSERQSAPRQLTPRGTPLPDMGRDHRLAEPAERSRDGFRYQRSPFLVHSCRTYCSTFSANWMSPPNLYIQNCYHLSSPTYGHSSPQHQQLAEPDHSD